MPLKPADIDHIIGLIQKITAALTKNDFLSLKEQKEFEQYREYEQLQRNVQQYEKLQVNPRDVQYRHLQYCQKKLTEMTYDSKRAALLHHMLSELKKKHIESKVPPLQKELDLFLSPRWKEVLALSDYGYQFRKEIEGYFVKRSSVLATDDILASQAKKVVRELERIKAKLEYNQKQLGVQLHKKQIGTEQKNSGTLTNTVKLLECVIDELEGWEKRYLPDNAQTGKIELVDIVCDEPLKKVVGWLEWCKHQPEVEKIKAECTKILRWFHTKNGVLTKSIDDNPFVTDGKAFNLKLKNALLDILGKIRADFAAEKPAETRQIGCLTSNITTKDIDKLLELFRQLENLLNPELPPRDGQLWFKAMEQSRKELADKLKKRQSGITLRPGRNNLKRDSIKARHPKKEEQAERIICQMAEKKYRLWDSKYNQSLSQVEEKIVEVVKRIDHTLYSMKEPLLAFDRTQGTLLQANFRNIRDDFTVNEIRQFQDMVKRSIDALEAIRLKVERQQHLEAPIKNQVSPNKKNAKTNQRTRLFAWLRKHPHSYGLTGGVIFLILFFVLGLFKAQWRNWCWGVAGLAFLVLILSLLGGRSRQ